MPIRIRLTLAFALATLVLFGVSGVLFERSFRHGVETSLDSGLRNQRDTLARELRSNGPGASLGSGNHDRVLPIHDVVAQILDANGRVLQTTQEAGRPSVISANDVIRARRRGVFVRVSVGAEHEPYRVLASPVASAGAMSIVVVATSLEATEAAVARVRDALIIGGSLAVVMAALGAWVLASAALRPVERMRNEAADISEHDATSRLKVPTTRDEIAALGTTMNALLERLQGALGRQRAFVADAGHELRTPLAVLRTELELAGRADRSHEDLRDAVEHAAAETDRLARLTEELLFLARSDNERADTHRDRIAVAPLLEQSVESVRADAEARMVNVVVDAALDGTVPANADLLRLAVVNLLENALRYSPPRTAVTVRGRRDGDAVTISVVDEGSGFPPDFLPHAFERFRRADDARSRVDGGTGLGLAIVLAVARAHGGTAEAANRREGGAVVTIRIPAKM